MSTGYQSDIRQRVVSGDGRIRRRLQIGGIVQGVGFRPFVFRLAKRLELSGFVVNTSRGVTAEIEGPASSLDRFIDLLQVELPPAARIESLHHEVIDVRDEAEFFIDSSIAVAGEYSLVSADLALCADCRRELLDPQDRRFAYPFINCTNCGPRYTIIQDLPYDRPATTMSAFRMCAECTAEYEDQKNRRFHAQPNACRECGPGLALISAGEDAGKANFEWKTGGLVGRVRELLMQGRIVAIKGLGGFHLACDAMNAAAVRQLRARKRRGDKPFAVMARDVQQVEKFVVITAEERKLLLSREAPIVVLSRRPDSRIADAVAPRQKTIGVMLPSTPLHCLLFGDTEDGTCEFEALVMTSGNISEEPIVTRNDEAGNSLREVADYFLLHDRDIYMRVDDSVARIANGHCMLLRRSRGYAPEPIDLGTPVTEIFACGAELKSTFCLTKDRYAILSQHIGDMENYETMLFFEETLNQLKKLFRVEPRAVAHDLHPQYLSTRWALQHSRLPAMAVQHHHAHVASCMAENRIEGKVIGVALDGTGYGTDGAIWGGEFLVADYLGFKRRAHFRYIPLPGGDAAIRQPWRSALAYLHDSFGEAALPLWLPLWQEVAERPRKLVQQMIAGEIQCVPTSSCGRLFDAVASLTGVRHEATYEGQAAIELEAGADNSVREEYDFAVEEGPAFVLDFRNTIREIVHDWLGQIAPSTIAARFHNTLASAIAEACIRIRDTDRLQRVCLSGGAFQNLLLMERTLEKLRSHGFDVYRHALIPPNDGGIALGQAVIANARLAGG